MIGQGGKIGASTQYYRIECDKQACEMKITRNLARR